MKVELKIKNDKVTIGVIENADSSIHFLIDKKDVVKMSLKDLLKELSDRINMGIILLDKRKNDKIIDGKT